MIFRLFIAVIVVAAITVGMLSICIHGPAIDHVDMFKRFFENSLPILGFGALVKYLITCQNQCLCGCNTPNCTCKIKV
jgi:hypothetical protein